MAIYHDPNGPAGDVMLAGFKFTDGRTADIRPSEAKLRLFKAWGITEVDTQPKPESADTTGEDAPAEKPSKKRK